MEDIGPILMRATVRPMRLLVITARYPTPDRPAAGAFVRDRLVGVDARVIAPSRYDLPGWRRYLSMTWRALTTRGRFDGVEGHFVLPSGAIALLAARIRGIPLVVYAHGTDVQAIAGRNALFGWLARRVIRGATVVVANSAETATTVATFVGPASTRVEVVPPGVDLSRFAASSRPTERRVLYLGGDLDYKGVEVARRLADTLAGPGIHEIAPAEIPKLLAEHDVVLMPSRREAFGLVAAEAIAAGRWVVARDVGGLREIVSDGVNGTLVGGDDFGGALENVPEYDPVVVAATAERFSLVTWQDRMARLWDEVLASD
jgi:glycosyltransferase involved in cell wall biosynthesis